VRCDDPDALQKEFTQQGVETATHFNNAIVWAKEFGYTEGQCPTAERLTKELLMIPTYRKI
jgi:dTDP-4-amino-4,6-dideoxygalactose transaminase